MPQVVGAIVGALATKAAAAIGLGALGASIAGAVVATGVNMLLAPKPKKSSLAADARGIATNTSSPVRPIPIIYGRTRVTGARVFAEVSGTDNKYLHLVIAWGEGPISEVETIYLDGVPETDPRFAGLITYGDGKNAHLGTNAQTADTVLVAALASWTTDHRLRGVAYTYLRLEYAPEAFPYVPEISADIKGRTLYDVSTGATAWSNNPANAIFDYLTNARYGRGVAAGDVDIASFQTARSTCNVLESVPSGTQLRYTCDGILSPDETTLDNLRDLLSACRGYLIFSGGKYKLVIDAVETSSYTFDETNIVGGWQIALDSKASRANRVRARYFNATRQFEPDFAVQDSTAYRAADNGALLERELELPMVTDYYRAMRISELDLEQSRYGITVSFNATLDGLNAEVGDVVSVTHATPGWAAKKFRVLAVELDSQDSVRIRAREYADIYAPGLSAAEPVPPTTTLPPPVRLETVLPIPELAASVSWIESFESGDMVGWVASGGATFAASTTAAAGDAAGRFTASGVGSYAYRVPPDSFRYAATVPGRRVRVQFWYRSDPSAPSTAARVEISNGTTTTGLNLTPTSTYQNTGFLYAPGEMGSYLQVRVYPDTAAGTESVLIDNIVCYVVPDNITTANIDQWIGSAAIGEAYIASAAITEAKIANLAVTAAKIANATITTAKIANAQVDTLQLAGNSVTSVAAGWYVGGALSLFAGLNYTNAFAILPSTTVRGSVLMKANATLQRTNIRSSSNDRWRLLIYRDGTTLVRASNWYDIYKIEDGITLDLVCTDVATTGVHYYYLYVQNESFSGTKGLLFTADIFVFENKR